METIVDQLLKEVDRVREIYADYKNIGAAGAWAANEMRKDMILAEQALANGDVIKIITAYKNLQEYSS